MVTVTLTRPITRRETTITFVRPRGETCVVAQAAHAFGAHDLDPRWDGFGNLELTLPANAEISRQDEPAGVTIIYR